MLGPDLREWIATLEKEGDIERIDGVDWDMELGGISELVLHKKEGPAVLFDKIKGYPEGYRVIVNLMGSLKRFGMATGIDTSGGKLSAVQAWRDKMRSIKYLPYQEVCEAEFQKNLLEANDLDLLKFPAPRWNELDGGRFLGTGCAVILKDPDSDWINVATYRAQVLDRETLGFCIEPGGHGKMIREKYFGRGEPCPVAVVFGGDPLVFLAASSRIPDGICEYEYAGGIRGEPVRVVRGELTGLPIPSDSEIVVEGFSYPGDEAIEGPFGEWTGYYGGGPSAKPVIRAERIMYRDNPIIHGHPNVKPPSAVTLYRGIIAAARIWTQLEAAGLPGVQGVWGHEATGTRYLMVISIKQRYSGHSKQALMLASQVGETFLRGRFTVVVDEDVDITNLEEVMWVIGSRCDPQRDIEIVKNTAGTRGDPCFPLADSRLDSRALIDACRPFDWRDGFPQIVQLSPELKRSLEKKWEGILSKYQ